MFKKNVRKITALLAAAALVFGFAACSDDDDDDGGNSGTTTHTLAVTGGASVTVKKTTTLTVTYDGTKLTDLSDVTWSANPTGKVSIENGVVTGKLAADSVAITATYNGITSAAHTLKVEAAISVVTFGTGTDAIKITVTDDGENTTAKSGDTEVTVTENDDGSTSYTVGTDVYKVTTDEDGEKTATKNGEKIDVKEEQQATTYTVKFYDGETELTDLATTVEEGEKVTKPADPTKDGYTFEGWYTTSALATAYDFTTAVTANTSIYAKWEKIAVPTYNGADSWNFVSQSADLAWVKAATGVSGGTKTSDSDGITCTIDSDIEIDGRETVSKFILNKGTTVAYTDQNLGLRVNGSALNDGRTLTLAGGSISNAKEVVKNESDKTVGVCAEGLSHPENKTVDTVYNQADIEQVFSFDTQTDITLTASKHVFIKAITIEDASDAVTKITLKVPTAVAEDGAITWGDVADFDIGGTSIASAALESLLKASENTTITNALTLVKTVLTADAKDVEDFEATNDMFDLVFLATDPQNATTAGEATALETIESNATVYAWYAENEEFEKATKGLTPEAIETPASYEITFVDGKANVYDTKDDKLSLSEIFDLSTLTSSWSSAITNTWEIAPSGVTISATKGSGTKLKANNKDFAKDGETVTLKTTGCLSLDKTGNGGKVTIPVVGKSKVTLAFQNNDKKRGFTVKTTSATISEQNVVPYNSGVKVEEADATLALSDSDKTLTLTVKGHTENSSEIAKSYDELVTFTVSAKDTLTFEATDGDGGGAVYLYYIKVEAAN